MIAELVTSKKGARSFRGLLAYMLSPQNKIERVGAITITNCVSTRPDLAEVEIANTQSSASERVKDPTFHFLFSFPATDAPTDEQLRQCEARYCEALGFAEHQRVSVVHHDTDHLHVHVAVNRIHPTTLRARDPWRSKLTLGETSAALEREFGFTPTRHHCTDPVQVARKQRVEALTAQLKKVAPALREARSWSELHDQAKAHGVQLMVRANGLGFVDADGIAVRASAVARDFGRPALVKRFGPFEPSTTRDSGGNEMGGARKAPPKMETLGGVESLRSWARSQCRDDLVAATSWAELHAVAERNGLKVRRRGAGLSLVGADGAAVKASSVDRDMSFKKLVAKLGAFEASATSETNAPLQRYQRRAAQPSNQALYERYQAQRALQQQDREAALAAIRDMRQRELQKHRRVSALRWEVMSALPGRNLTRRAWAQYARFSDKRIKEKLAERHRARLQALRTSHPKMGWLQWLRAQAEAGDAVALDALRQRGKSELGKGPMTVAPAVGRLPQSPTVFAGIDSVTSSGTVIYSVPGGTIRDAGDTLTATGDVTTVGAEAFLRLARHRFGERLGVTGDEAFCTQLVNAAVDARLPITFADEALETRRVQLMEESRGRRRTDDNDRRGRRQGPERWQLGQRNRIGGPTRQPDVAVVGGKPPAPSLGALPNVSESGVARFGPTSEVLLPPAAHRDLGQQGDRRPAHHSLRRAHVQRPLTLEPDAPRRSRKLGR